MLTRGFSLIFAYSTPTTASYYAWKNGQSTFSPTALITQGNSTQSNLKLVPPPTSPSNYMYFSFMSLGSGDTPATFEDANLAEPISDFTQVSGQMVLSQGGKQCFTYTCTVRNDTASAITVKEIGVGGYHWGTGSSNTSGIMIARSVLDTPVTIQPGETYAFTYTIEV